MKHFSEISPTAERVVDAAEGLVQQHGYNGFSYDDVAQLVGIKKPSIHHHFPKKGELVAVVAQRYTHRFREELLSIEGQHAKAPDRLTAYAALFERTFAKDRRLCVCGMLGAESDSLPDAVVSEVERFFYFLKKGIHINQIIIILQSKNRFEKDNERAFSDNIFKINDEIEYQNIPNQWIRDEDI